MIIGCESALSIYRTDLHQICRFGKTMAVDETERSEVSFSIPQGTLPWQPILIGIWSCASASRPLLTDDYKRWSELHHESENRARVLVSCFRLTVYVA